MSFTQANKSDKDPDFYTTGYHPHKYNKEPDEIRKCNEEGAYIMKIKSVPKWSLAVLPP